MANEPVDSAVEPARQDLAQPVPPALAARADDLEAIRNAAVDAAGAAVGIWLSYLLGLFYLLIAAAGVTHRDLFFGTPVKLPFLNIDLPLKGFFWFGPALFLVMHVYVLLHFVLLAGKVGVLDTALRAQIDDSKVRERLRRQLPSNIFVQLLAGPREVRNGLVGVLLRLIAWISLVIGPIALLVLFQLQFLPYHNESITLWQRIAVVIDLGLLWALWPSVVRGKTIRDAWRSMRRNTVALMTITSTALVLFVFVIATFPGEKLEQLADIRIAKSVHSFFVAGDVDLVARKPKSIWSNRLVLPQLDVIDHAKFDTETKIAAMPMSVSLRTRNFRGAVLIGASLRSVDFAGADLREAWFDTADLRSVDFTGADLRDTRLEQADMRGAKLACGGPPYTTSLPKQPCARLQNSTLNGADMQGVSLRGAELQGASLEGANLDGASLISAQLLGASLGDASLRGATLLGAGFEGADLRNADLQGASLNAVNFQGAYLGGAKLRGALLESAELQGVVFSEADLRSAFLMRAFVWRADARPNNKYEELSAKIEGTRIGDLEMAPRFACTTYSPTRIPQYNSGVCDWSNSAYENLKRRAKQISSDSRRRDFMNRIERLNPNRPLEGEAEMARHWVSLTGSSPSDSTYQRGLIRELTHIGCEPAGAPYVLGTIIPFIASSYSPLFGKQGGQSLSILAAAFLDKEHCPGARELSESAKATLKELLTTAGKPE